METWALFSSSNGFKISPHTSLSRDSSVPNGGIQSTSFVFSPPAVSPPAFCSAASLIPVSFAVPAVPLPSPAAVPSFPPFAPQPVASIPAIAPARTRLRHFFILFFIVFASFSYLFGDGLIIALKPPSCIFSIFVLFFQFANT